MNDDYLWTGSGQPDADIERLEQALRPFAHRPQPLKLPRRSRWVGIAILCASCFVVSVFAWAQARPTPDHNSPTVEAHLRSYDAGPVDGSE